MNELFYSQETNSTPQPDLIELLTKDLCTFTEGVCLLTEWPKDYLYYTSIMPLGGSFPTERRGFYLPKGCKEFIPQTDDAKKVYHKLKRSIEVSELKTKFFPNKLFLGYFIDLIDLIFWALTNDFVLPKKLQRLTKLHQIPDRKLNKSLEMKIKHKIIGQFEIHENPSLSVTEILDGELMSKFGNLHEKATVEDLEYFTNRRLTGNDDLKTYRMHVNELYSEKGRRGIKPKNKSKINPRGYQPMPIPEVLEKDPNGQCHYHFESLRIAMVTAAKIVMYKMGRDEFKNHTYEEFKHKFESHPVVRLYLDGTAEMVEFYIKRVTKQAHYDRKPLSTRFKKLKDLQIL
jgi:hypothetical protein